MEMLKEVPTFTHHLFSCNRYPLPHAHVFFFNLTEIQTHKLNNGMLVVVYILVCSFKGRLHTSNLVPVLRFIVKLRFFILTFISCIKDTGIYDIKSRVLSKTNGNFHYSLNHNGARLATDATMSVYYFGFHR